jgi:rhamnose transport system substrate-binding protein
MMAIRFSAPGRRLTMAVAGAAVVAMALTGCGGATKGSTDSSGSGGAAAQGKANPNGQIKKGLKIAFLPKQTNNPYFTTLDSGGKKAVDAIGGAYKEVGTSSATDTAGQVSYVNTLTQQGENAIILSAQDPNALCTSLKQAMSAKISVVTYDSDTNPDCRQAFINQASGEALGRSEV